jgi:hypothetical protein
MISSTARVETDRADRYVTQLCRHFAHKVPAESDSGHGRADFGWGVCTLTATPDALLLHAEAEDVAGLERVEFVVGDHAERFGARDGLAVTWQRSPV